MRRLLQGQYTGGAYELRKYQNGAFALVLPALDRVSASYGMTEESITLEGASIAANLIALGQLMVVSDEIAWKTGVLPRVAFPMELLDPERRTLLVILYTTAVEQQLGLMPLFVVMGGALGALPDCCGNFAPDNVG